MGVLRPDLAIKAVVPVIMAGIIAIYGLVVSVLITDKPQQPRLFVTMILILIFAEVLGLYGLIVGLILNTKADTDIEC
ncbi:hypothetical protein H4R34_004652 [Dimargaris verticillata]|uniref:V-ATPase proteolipid subunit C-like domain-containing protein n=1 Tax=Dimargaris verticillata TaxID=2761393 RepID=A0A9W8B4H0_9FUNG|nr:hypothetical protein H4R34_004652 [Dimargaris verticillata]